MSTLTLQGARWLCVALVSLLGLATFAPSAALADTDLTIGGTAVVNRTEGSGTTLRSTPSYDAEVLLTVPAGTTVNVNDGPVSGGGSLWYAVTVSGEDGYLPAIFLTSGEGAAPADTAPATTDEAQAAAVSAASTDTGAPAVAAAETGSAVIAGTNGDGVRCRTAPSYAGAVINVVPEGANISLNGASTGEWQPTTCDGTAGYVHTDFVSYGGEAPAAAPVAAPVGADTSLEAAAVTGYSTVAGTNGDGVRCRSAASYSASTITVLTEGTSVALSGPVQGEWQPVVCAGTNGFAHASFIGGSGAAPVAAPEAPSAAGAGTVTGYTTVTGTNGEGLRCRSAASYSASTITVLPEGTSVAIRGGAQGEWQPIVCAGMNGFAFASFLGAGSGTAAPTPSEPDTSSNTVTGSTTVTGTNGEGLRCRSAASYSASTITVIPEGTSVATRGGAQGEWQPIVCAGMNGFAHVSFLGAGSGTAAPAPQAPEAAPTVTAAPVQSASPASSGLAGGSRAKVTTALNLRYAPNYSSGVAAIAESGTVVLITGGVQNGFYPIDWDGLGGFMHGDYLVATSAALSERGGSAAPPPAPTTPAAPDVESGSGSAIVSFALQYEGYPYVWATAGPASFDCSGFTYWVIKNVVGLDIGRGLFTQVAAGRPVSRAELQPGDLVFFQNTYTWGLSHNGVYIGNGKMIHAENETTGVKISDINSDYYSSRWYGAVRF